MTIDKKLQVKAGMLGGVFHLSEEVKLTLPRLDSLAVKDLDYILVFTKTSLEIEKYALKATKAIKEDGLLWFAYPKKTGKIKTDISRDIGWATLKKLGYDSVRLVSIDETWSAFRFRLEKYISK